MPLNDVGWPQLNKILVDEIPIANTFVGAEAAESKKKQCWLNSKTE